MKNEKLRKLVFAAVLAAFVCVATMIIRIPTPTKGYVNLGDCIVLVSGWLLGPVYGGAAAGIGSMFADIISGYFTYAPATLIIKALMAVEGYFVFNLIYKKLPSLVSRIISAVIAEIIMCAGYFLFEAALYGSFATAATGMFGNLVQGIMGVVGSVLIYEAVIKRIPAVKKLQFKN